MIRCGLGVVLSSFRRRRSRSSVISTHHGDRDLLGGVTTTGVLRMLRTRGAARSPAPHRTPTPASACSTPMPLPGDWRWQFPYRHGAGGDSSFLYTVNTALAPSAPSGKSRAVSYPPADCDRTPTRRHGLAHAEVAIMTDSHEAALNPGKPSASWMAMAVHYGRRTASTRLPRRR